MHAIGAAVASAVASAPCSRPTRHVRNPFEQFDTRPIERFAALTSSQSTCRDGFVGSGTGGYADEPINNLRAGTGPKQGCEGAHMLADTGQVYHQPMPPAGLPHRPTRRHPRFGTCRRNRLREMRELSTSHRAGDAAQSPGSIGKSPSTAPGPRRGSHNQPWQRQRPMTSGVRYKQHATNRARIGSGAVGDDGTGHLVRHDPPPVPPHTSSDGLSLVVV